ncbi:primosomal protein N' [Clostridium grantii]|uniref:Replication restart protein PriA n=1 Tax=Clostridium grantii DSM 8605 TaxID=1121316 RepID=A0A1M5QT82_9CLOT|nr:primosomal protein N' [Clostridium grantii]SHH17282.1 replication restart DNA helicase PriA [Clostridium grantii DSM 8605]
MNNYAGIIVNNEAKAVDRLFTYKIPEELKNKILLGQMIKVPFGRSNKKIDAFVMELYSEYNEIGKLKEIISINNETPLLSKEHVQLIKVMKDKYLCSYLDCIKVMIPTGITRGNKAKTSALLFLGEPLKNKYLKEPYESIFQIVKNNNGLFNKSALSKKFNISLSSINTMIKNGFILSEDVVVSRYSDREYENYKSVKLNFEQQYVVSDIMESNENMFLIHGVTGSGKTEIYMNLVTKMMKLNKDSIILVPEISLTPQMVERFKGRFGKEIAVFHSKLGDGERYDEWNRVKNGEVKVAIGARSAIFLPFNNLGLIIIDEEHELSYKSDSNPKYDTREIAELKSGLYNCKLILGTATPSVESYYKAKENFYKLLKLSKRVNNYEMPKVSIVDMRNELMKNNKSIFSEELYNDINEKLDKKEQIIIFLNRRGFSTFVSCRKCGYVFKCDSCDISLTYHQKGNYMNCHYCGKQYSVKNSCPKCNSKYVKFFGVGTEKIQSIIEETFPRAKTLRMDFDTTRKKDSHEEIYNKFKNREADILIGTQMIAKGLDFENVTLVGIIAADISLNIPDYRAEERTYQLITQVSGRAGRGNNPGKVVIQTYEPQNQAIIYASQNNYEEFYESEIALRAAMNYPPFGKILLINFSSKNEEILIKNTQKIGYLLKHKLSNSDKIVMLGPTASSLSRIKEYYRWQILIKGKFDNEFENKIKNFIYENLKTMYNDIRVSLDVNPGNMM